MYRLKLALAALLVTIVTGAVPSTAQAEVLPPLDQVISSSEQQLLSSAVRQQLADPQTDSQSLLKTLDALMEKDLQPTKFRGYLQFVRASALIRLNRDRDAVPAIDESIRLLPGYSGPLLMAVDVYRFAGRAGEATDYLLRASQIDPEVVRSIDDYAVWDLVRRLDAAKEHNRVKTLAVRLLQIGWSGGQLEGRSTLASRAMEQFVEDGDLPSARRLISDVVIPKDTYALLTDNRYRDLWPDLEKWAGPKLQSEWNTYLTEARARFVASGRARSVVDYAAALDAADNSSLMIADVLPVFSNKLRPDEDADLVFAVARVASALSQEGRWSDVRSLFETTERIWPIGTNPNALNLTANHARFLLYEGRYEDAVKMFDASLDDAKKWGGEVNADAIASMHLYRACALHRLNRDAEAAVSIAAAMSLADPQLITTLHLCLGDKAGARNAILTALAAPESRNQAILSLQSGRAACRSAYCETIRTAQDEFAADPAILTQLQKYGRILPFSLSDAAKSWAPPATAPADRPAPPVALLSLPQAIHPARPF